MGLRETIDKNPALGYGLVGGIIVLAVVTYILTSGEKEFKTHGKSRYYYDMDSKSLYVITETDHPDPPMKAPSGGEGVYAVVFSCSDCKDKASLEIGMLTKYSKELLDALIRKRKGEEVEGLGEIERKGKLVRFPDSDDWVRLDSEDGSKINIASMRGRDKCPKTMKTCWPEEE